MNDESKDDVFDVDRVRSLVELMIEHGLSEIDLRQHGSTVRLKRELSAAPLAVPQPVLPAAPPAPAAPSTSASESDDLQVVTSPMVGTFYGRPNPEAEPFVKVGQSISKKSTVCIIEAMKVFNEIEAEVSGTIEAILVEDGEPVEFGKPLMKVRPN